MHPAKLLLASGLALLVSLPALGQNRSSDRWVASWATALVARPPGQGGPGGRGQGPAARTGGANGASRRDGCSASLRSAGRRASGACATRRRARRISSAGDDLESDHQAGGSRERGRRAPARRVEQRLRHGARRDRRGPRRASRPRRDGQVIVGEAADVWRELDREDSAWRDDRQRCRRSRGAGGQRSRRGPVPARASSAPGRRR